MPRWPFGGRWQSVNWSWSAFSLVLIPLPANWHYSFLLALFSLHRTGLEAIMETYAFWRPPVRTLTFEDFTTMQKQQGERTKGMQRAVERAGEEGGRAATCSAMHLVGSRILLSSWLLWKDTAERVDGNGGQAVPYEVQWSCFISLVFPVHLRARRMSRKEHRVGRTSPSTRHELS